MSFTPYGTPIALKTATPNAGFALQNATPSILSWTAPNDGNIHQVIIPSILSVTVLEVGGQVNVTYTDLGGNVENLVMYGSALGVGSQTPNNAIVRFLLLLPPGNTVTIAQAAALTSGAASLWAQIWAS